MLLFSSRSLSQNLIINNPYETPLVLDSLISIEGKTLDIHIGPENKKSQNTVFIESPIRINNSTVKSTNLHGSFFKEMTIYKSLLSGTPVLVSFSNFDKLYLLNSRVSESLFIKNCNIDELKLLHDTIEKTIYFENCNFKNVLIGSTDCKGKVLFNNCTFGKIDFTATIFNEDVDLSGSNFTDTVNMDFASFQKNLSLRSIRASQQTNISFLFTVLPDTLDFSDNANSANIVDLYNARPKVFAKKCAILLHSTDVSKIKMSYDRFTLAFTRNISADEKLSMYEKLLENFKRNSYSESFKSLDIEYKRYSAQQGPFGFLWWIPEYWWQYGYKKENIFTIIFWAIMIFTAINYFSYKYMATKVYSIENISKYPAIRISNKIWIAFIYTIILFFSLSLKLDRVKFDSTIGVLYLFVLYSFGTISLAYMANYIIQH